MDQDNAKITKIWWVISEESIMGDDYDAKIDDRTSYVIAFIGRRIQQEFPNARDIQVRRTDAYSPRWEDADGNNYDYHDTFDGWEQYASTKAFELYPIPEPVEIEGDDDPQCVCGVHRSEHALCGCPEGFTRLGYTVDTDNTEDVSPWW